MRKSLVEECDSETVRENLVNGNDGGYWNRCGI